MKTQMQDEPAMQYDNYSKDAIYDDCNHNNYIRQSNVMQAQAK